MAVVKMTIEEALAEHKGLVTAYARKYKSMFPVWWEREDREQFIYLKFIESFAQFDEEKGELGPFLGSVLYNKICELRKTTNRKKRIPADKEFMFCYFNSKDEDGSGTDTVNDYLLKDDRFDNRSIESITLDMLIDEQPKRDKAVLTSLRNGETYGDIAEHFGVSRQMVHVITKAAIKRIKLKHGELDGL